MTIVEKASALIGPAAASGVGGGFFQPLCVAKTLQQQIPRPLQYMCALPPALFELFQCFAFFF